MFLTTLGQRFPRFSTYRSANTVVHSTVNRIVQNSFSSIRDLINPTLGSLSLCISFSTSRGLEPHFLKLGSPGSRVGSTQVIRIYNRKTLKPVLSHLTAFLAYLEDKESRFSWCYNKKPDFEILARSDNNRGNHYISPHGMSKEMSFRMSAFVTNILVWSTKSRPFSASLQA